MRATYLKIVTFLFVMVILSGCLYPNSSLVHNQVANEAHIESVQVAVNKYKEEQQGLVPIKTKPSDTPIFEKYIIDFNILKDHHLLAEIPGNAFERGGVFQYVLITPEVNPQVKLIDLRTADILRKVNVQLNNYRLKNLYPPFGEEISKGIYTINYKKIGFDREQYVLSPYSGENLPLVMDVNGDIYIDYRIDLYRALNEFEHEYVEGDDIRYLIAENTPFVPAYSLPYTILNDEPVFNIEN